ncbi:hemerythrin domain-containing protein [Azospirillum isscasi]|uniref:Hemerythrin domain-containing protein n=1 Tax=Azospirillum isscasi TaxID=3053926 RepID=A0ABU0WNA9_9PROT|nr:hemerythrin domain-containing protein [Azospirillum isscasi]MDQ2104334.1 hemerythrin domain-containing protein [Azospirillum isscasi]
MSSAAISTTLYRTHHTTVGQLVGRIEAMLAAPSPTANAAALATTVRDLFGIFTVHLSLEDSALYPRLLAHPTPALRATAARFQAEMGNLRARFDRYRAQWPGPLAVSKDPDAFVRETREVVAALKQRIAREDLELYDVIDRAALAGKTSDR